MASGGADRRTTILLLSADEAENVRYSLPAAIGQEGSRVVVVDNASSDSTAAIAREHGAEYMRFERRHSYCEAINEALAATDGEAVLLLNADCFLAPGFLAAARPRLDEPGVGSVSPRLIRTMGPRPEQRSDVVDTVGIVMHRCRKNLLAGHDVPLPAYEAPGEAFGVDGAAALYRRETLHECAVEGAVLDEDFEMWASDVDLAWRARLLGWRCVYEPRAFAYHVRTYRPDTRSQMSERARVLVFRNRYLMMAKNDSFADLLGDLHHIAAYEALAFAYALLRERHLMRGYAEAARLLPSAWHKRTVVQRRRRMRDTPKLTFGEEPGGRAQEAGHWDTPALRRTFNSQFVTLWRALAGPRR